MLVSVALATYNGEKFLREQLESLLIQTYKNFEVIITDDASSDGTQRILEDFAAKDSRIKWSLNTRPRGVTSNFTEAISLCTGDIVFLCDQDDVWYSTKLEKHLERYKNPAVKWVYNEVAITNENLVFQGVLPDTLPDYYMRSRMKLRYYAWGSCILGCATSFRRSIIKDIWPADPHAPGHDSWMQLAIYPALPAYIPEVLQDYRQHGNNVVGIQTTKRSNEEEEQNKKKAIENNIRFLKSLYNNKQLQNWKRMYFLAIFLAKKIRSLYFV